MSVLPRHERALLEATLRDGEAALAAFAEWRSSFDFEGEHEAGAFGLLGLLHANMTRLGLQDPIMARLGGVRRHGWVQGQRRQSAAVAATRLLASGGIRAMFTRGAAIAADYYPDPASRPRQDINLLVRPDQADAALDLLGRAGWSPRAPLTIPRERRAGFIALHTGIGLGTACGHEVDLHWQAIGDCCPPFLLEWFWSDAQVLDLGEVQVLRPATGQLLFHALGNGLHPNAAPSLLWIADTAMILRRRRAEIDWEVFWDIARRARLEQRLAEGLATVSQIARLDLPQGAQRTVRGSTVELLEGAALGQARLGRAPARARWLRRLARVMRAGQGQGLAHGFRLIAAWLGERNRGTRLRPWPALQNPDLPC